MRTQFAKGASDLWTVKALLIACLLMGAARVEAGVVFSQAPVNHAASRISDWSDDKEKSDDFILVGGPRLITKINWWGSYGANPDPAADSFTFRFFAGDPDTPGFPSCLSIEDGTRYPRSYSATDYSRQATSLVSDPSGSHDGGMVYAYSAVLDRPIVLEGNKQYWLAIANATAEYIYPPTKNSRWGWLGSSSGSQWYRMAHCPLCADDWTISNTTHLAFSLEALPEIAGYKSMPDGMAISGTDAFVTAAFVDFFYARVDDRTSAIRVKSPGHTLVVSNKVHIEGSLSTNDDCERFIDASSATQIDGGATTSPLGMRASCLGGGPFNLQCGVQGGKGVNNIGMLVRIWGLVTSLDPSSQKTWFVVSDGSGFVKVTVPGGTAVPRKGDHVIVTGISSCEESGDQVVGVVRVPLRETIRTVECSGL